MDKKPVKVLENIDTSVKSMKVITLAAVLGFAVIAFAGFYLYTNIMEKSIDRVYVATDYSLTKITDDKAMVKGHVINFMTLFFSIDQYNYKKNVNKALNLIGESGKELNATYSHKNWYSNIVNNNLSIGLDIDSVSVLNNASPYQVKVIARQVIRGGNATEVRFLNAQMEVRKVSNSETNPYGYMIENFVITNNSTIPPDQQM